MLRSFESERGTWAQESKVYWKLDKTENYSRMRLKLKRNYDFNDHSDAVLNYQPNITISGDNQPSISYPNHINNKKNADENINPISEGME